MIGSEENSEQGNEHFFRLNITFLNGDFDSGWCRLCYVLTAFLDDPAASIEKHGKNHVDYKLGKAKGNSRLDVLRSTSEVNWFDI